ncbi:hypothetical protein [Protaetiibacter mangrovi]|uniref:Polysaccharide biosynthesis protein C-terminal domain-containing protein n=1 Tax=Protaetiibacter mangrovi TaxID=2970926 RepID=A0ABT1ZHP7_9MICO|nr:hypothetical protein [Protaetiibacter mangrovi]MCS0500226.1 hypothetical protein [Protaetiibacter mangrovi]
MSATRRVVGFALVPLLGAVIPLVALPAITSAFGATAWAAIAVAVALGAIAGTLVELGWSWNGPLRIARSGVGSRRRTIALSIASRMLTFVPAAILCALLAPLVAPGRAFEAITVAIATCALGLGNTWVFIGLGRPWRLLALDTAPRIAFVSLATLLIHLGAGLWVYGVVGLLLPALLLPATTALALGVRAADFRGITLARAAVAVRAQRHVTLARLVSNGYLQLPTILVAALVDVAQLAVFAAGDRLAKMGLAGLAPMPSMFQSWVGAAATRRARVERALRAVAVNAGVGVLAGGVFAVAAPWASELLFSGTATIDLRASAVLGVMIAVVTMSRAVGGIALAAAGAQGGLLRSAVVGSLVGLPAIALLTIAFGAEGAFVGVLIAEAAVLTTQLATLIRFRRRAAAAAARSGRHDADVEETR